MDGFDVDIVGVSVTTELRVFEITGNGIRFSLAFGPPRAGQYPEIDITSSVSVASSYTSIEKDTNNIANVLTEPRDGGFDGLVELRLWNPEDRIVRNRQALSVNLYGSPVTFGRLDDQIIRAENVHCPSDGLVGMINLRREFPQREAIESIIG